MHTPIGDETSTLSTTPNYPAPQIPMSPVLSGATFSKGHPSKIPSILDLKHIVHVTSGRVALAMALKHAGIRQGDDVLIPAYHCESMVTPVRWAGAHATFYRICSNTTIDLEDLESKVTPKTRALVVAHYFGFLQDISVIRNFCDKHRILMIEDCAHAFFGTRDNHAIGSAGDYAIASAMKFFAVYDGGCLASSRRDLSKLQLRSPSPSLQMRSAFNIVERALTYRRLNKLAYAANLLINIKNMLWRLIILRRNRDHEKLDSLSSAEGGFEFNPAWVNVRMSSASRSIISLSLRHDISHTRRRNYLRLLEATKDLPGCRALFSSLPDNTVPLVFPLFVDHPKGIFSQLKELGVPIWRFGEFLDQSVDSSVCAVSVALSQHVLQFPCHQELKESELEWMIDCIRGVFLEPSKGNYTQ